MISDAALANYPTTFVSLASTLEMAYLVDDTEPVGALGPYYSSISGDNATVSHLRAAGYHYVHAFSPGAIGCPEWAARCIGGDGVDETTNALWRSTPFAAVPQRLATPLEPFRRHANPVTVVDELFRDPPPEPHVLFAHLLTPHPPFAWHADCSPRPTDWQISDWRVEELEAFGATVECLNQRLLEAVDRIVARDPEAVIVIQGDHGTAFNFSWTRRGPDDVGQRLPILSAVRLSSGCRDDIPDDLTAVNTFRLMFACLAGTPPDLLENRHYWGEYQDERFEAVRHDRVAPTGKSN